MRYLSPKNLLLAFAAVGLIALSYWYFVISHKSVDELVPHFISDIVFAIFVVFFIDYANKKDRQLRSRARRRALAFAVQKFYQNLVATTDAYISDGVIASKLTSLPASDLVAGKAKDLHSTTSLPLDFSKKPTPFGAYFICEFTGGTKANVLPERSAREYISQLTNQHEELYRDIFYFDNGFLPDDLVDVLTKVKSHGLFLLGRSIMLTPRVRMGYWPEKELSEIVSQLDKLQLYFSAELGYSKSVPEDVIRNAVLNSLNRAMQVRPKVKGAN